MSKTILAKSAAGIIAVILCAAMFVSSFVQSFGGATEDSPLIKLFNGELNTNREEYYDNSSIYKLPVSVQDTDDLSLIVCGKSETLLDRYETAGGNMTFAAFSLTDEAKTIRENIAEENARLLEKIDASGVAYTYGLTYDTLLSGFEITVKAKDFEGLCKTLGDKAEVIVSEVYKAAEVEKHGSELVENKVNVQDTGIFDSKGFAYDGEGMVIAVLDTGLDYTHTAFSLEKFTSTSLGLTKEQLTALLASKDFRAEGMQSGLTASDLYINDKVPFGFDYADRDAEVFPLLNYHGTHVAGIIAGNDDVITGVAPNAQLAIMKTFSDVTDSARASWIIAALEDCVLLEVDVINMSLGTSCGFSRETDKEAESGVYDRIRSLGISLVVAASNAYSSNYGSDKNGNLGLTSNPDTATVGSPSTYEGALSVASINGVKTPYLLYNESIIYFTESTDRVSEEKNFVEELLPAGVTEMEFEYVTIPGAGRAADYSGLDVTGKIALVRRGSNTFEEKANVAEAKGAAGIIIYNNVSGEIKMTVGEATIAVCSIRQDDGELLAQEKTGKIKISTKQKSGPFMSDFSSWGPTPDLGIKPEITAHGGYILSAMTGQDYDRISGTSMATPNMSGVVALLREYVMARFPEYADGTAEDNREVAAIVNRLLMSTADIIKNTNGLPYAVRKQGAGLANLNKSAQTNAYILTRDRVTGEVMDKSKIELGDDPKKTGVYELRFSVQNFGTEAITYDISTFVMTEGVSETKTHDGETTVTEEAYLLSGATTAVTANGVSGKTVTVAAGKTLDVTVKITLSDEDKEYLDTSFENGMYVEGFVVLNAKSESEVDLSVPYLAFYGDWTRAPLFDIDYFETNADELDDSIELLDKTLPDAYATRPIGGVEGDYVSYLGSYYFQQNPSAKIIAADRDFIAISNQEGTVHSLRFVWAGMLRGADKVVITITDAATGEEVFRRVENDIRKSYGDGGSIYPANIDVEFDAAEQGLKNNTKYLVRLEGYLDYGEDGGRETNLNNNFEFPLYVDFEAPAVSGCEFFTEYDKSAKKTRLYARIAVYDNHYAMAMNVGYVGRDDLGEYMLYGFDRYLTPIYSSFNGTTYVEYELTDYVHEIKENAVNKNSFTVAVYDYALNEATYEIALPDEYTDFYIDLGDGADSLTLNPNEVYDLAEKAVVYPANQWSALLEYVSTNTAVADIVNGKIVAKSSGTTMIRVIDRGTNKRVQFVLTVRAEGDEGYKKYDKPVADEFYLTGYYVDKAYYQINTDDQKIGETGDERKFGSQSSYSLSLYPSESVTLRYKLDAYFPDDVTVEFKSNDEKIVKVDAKGTITAVAEGFSSITVRVKMDGKNTYYAKTVSIEVKDPFITSGPSLTHYFGLGGTVEFPKNLAITEIGQFAFSNFDYVPKDTAAGDVINDEDPETSKIWFLGDNTITTVIVPEGVETIGAYAFANLTALERVVLPSTLKTISYGAFYGCTSLKEVEGIEHVQLINRSAFQGCALTKISLGRAVAIADLAFAENKNLETVTLAPTTQSVASYAFYGCKNLVSVTIEAEKLSLGEFAFAGCTKLTDISLNAAVLPRGVLDGCTALTSITIGKDVKEIGEYAFRGTALATFKVAVGNTVYASGESSVILSGDGTKILLVAPKASLLTGDLSAVTAVANGAFSGNTVIETVSLPNVVSVGDYAFAGCTRLSDVTLGNLTYLGRAAFMNTAVKEFTVPASLTVIGDSAFRGTKIASVTIPDGVTVGSDAFRDISTLKSVTLGDNVIVGDNAFRIDLGAREGENWTVSSVKIGDKRVYYYVMTSPIKNITIGKNATLGYGAFYGAAAVETVTLGEGAKIGREAFFNAASLKNIDLSKATEIGEGAFYGFVFNQFTDNTMQTPYVDASGNYVYAYYSAPLTAVDLSSVTSVGKEAFAYCRSLASVTLGEATKAIGERAFAGCSSLSAVDLSNVTEIGAEAFFETALVSPVLTAATHIGDGAFAKNASLVSVRLSAEGTVVGEYAFAYSSNLATVENLDKVTSVGAFAFAETALTSADLSSATYIGEHAFMKTAPTPFTVTLGASLAEIGDNPFAFCILPAFSATEKETFNGVDYEKTVYSYAISDSVLVIDGSLYRKVPNGYELVAFAGDGKRVTVADGTVRIAAMAFAGASVSDVFFPASLASIGHKAFYACSALSTVSFTSYRAPILEELYDEAYYVSGENLPATGDYLFQTIDGDTVTISGLGIVPYFMWNATSAPYVIYYGANFVDYVGCVENKIVMVSPSNGKNYDSFIFDAYFATAVAGAVAADETTLAAIAAIAAIPSSVKLSDKATVEAARRAYDLIASHEQRALVSNFTKLSQAESRISDLEYLQGGGDTPSTPPTDTPDAPPADDTPDAPPADDTPIVEESVPVTLILTIVFASLFGLSAAAATVFGIFLLKAKKKTFLSKVETAAKETSEGDLND